jgi:molecular chaperone IbpA
VDADGRVHSICHLLNLKEKTMTKITTLDLSPFYRNSIGIDRLFDRIVNQIDTASNSNTNYPPYNILKTGNNTYEIQVAVAGFTQGEVTVNVNEGELIIAGEKADAELPEGHKYEHQGISARRFVRTFSLADYVEVQSAISKDGILTVKLERQVPDAMKPKTIAISYES